MSYRLEGKDIVISGFEEGIADSPYLGIGDIRNVNLLSRPGEAAVNYKTQAMTVPPTVNAAAFTATDSSNTISWTPGGITLYKGLAIVLNTNSATGLSTNKVYYVGNISGSTFQLFTSSYNAASNVSPVNITSDGSGTFSTYQLAKPMHSCVDKGQVTASSSGGVPSITSFIVDSKNQVWLLASYNGADPYTPGTLIYLGNKDSTIGTGDNSICVWANYLFLFRPGAIDIWNMDPQEDPATAWSYSWAGLSLNPGSGRSLRSLAAQDNALYVCNGAAIASVLENPNETFDPTDSTTYTANSTALALPTGERATCLAELGTNLLIGGSGSFVYPWDRVSTSYSYPLVVPERYIQLIVGTNSNAFIFAGNRGNIYITNGANIDLFKKIPDYISGETQPYYLTGGVGLTNATTASGQTQRGDALYWRNQIYFSVLGFPNGSTTALTTLAGVWAIDITTGALRFCNKPSYNTYAGTVSVIVPDMGSFRTGGEGLFFGWIDGDGNIGVDNSINTPYTNYETYIETDIIPVGTYLDSFTPSQLEWKSSKPLVSGESVKIYYRTNLTESYTLIGTSSTVGALSDVYQTNFQKAQWIQLKVEYNSTASTPSFVPLYELRIRDFPGDNKK